MDRFSTSQIRLKGDDAHGLTVESVYSRFDPRYAVYRTKERVSIQFADDPELEGRQREVMARLSPLRGEINGLVDGWRTSRRERFIQAAQRYDRRVADALIVALEGDADSALQILPQVRDDVVAERKSLARFMYLICAALTAAVLGLIACFAISDFAQTPALFGPLGPYTVNTWLAVAAGTLGAFFSIALGISSRSIHTDLQMMDNVIDAVVRVLIGAIAAVVLQAVLDANLFSFHLGATVLGAMDRKGADGATLSITPSLVMFVAAFIGGFSERLIPDLLDSATMAVSDKPQTASPTPKPVNEQAAKGDGDDGTETQNAVATLDSAPVAVEKIGGRAVAVATAVVPPLPDGLLVASGVVTVIR